DGTAPASLLDSYSAERIAGAVEDILNSTRSTDFITPKSEISRIFRDAVLRLAENHDFARPLVNSGRLSVPCTYDASPLNGADTQELPIRTRPGAPAPDAPTGRGWLLDQLGNTFQLLAVGCALPDRLHLNSIDIGTINLDPTGHPELAQRYLGSAAAALYLIRPDQHIAARWTSYAETAVLNAVRTAIAQS
ncbi:MAG: FAD-dependent oxidoreductase, partial [Paracoccaceae bacterium]